MSFDRSKVINIALEEVGYLEKASNSQLDSKTANAGSANYTKYARDLDDITGFYNGKKNGYAWCDVFVDWCFVQAFGADAAMSLLCQPKGSAGAGCTYSARYYKNKGQFHTNNPQIGDQIFFGNASESTHTGLVYAVDSSRVYTVEGNTSGASGVIANGGGVCKKSYPLGSSWIYGYGRPAYEDNATANKITTKAGECEVELNELSKGDKGKDVKALQILLIGNGYSCGWYGADGEFGAATFTAVKAYQKAKGLDADGIVGLNTWTKLLKG